MSQALLSRPKHKTKQGETGYGVNYHLGTVLHQIIGFSFWDQSLIYDRLPTVYGIQLITISKTSVNRYPICSSHFLAQAALRSPPEVAFAMRSWPLLLPTFCLLLLHLLLLTHIGETPEAENLFPPIFYRAKQDGAEH